MSDIELGKLIKGVAHRDAIHIAVAPVEAAGNFAPGDHVGLMDDGRASGDARLIGIVDPFLRQDVKEGEKFYLFLYPNTITSLRHDWVHPAFPSNVAEENDLALSRSWVTSFAESIGHTYEALMEDAETWIQSKEWSRYGDYIMDNSERYKGHFHGFETFWSHYETIKGVKVKDDDKECFYTCSC